MRQRNLIVAMLCFSSLVLVLADSLAKAQQKDLPIRVKGANAMASLCETWAREFSSTNQGQPVIVVGGGTDVGFGALFDKTVDLLMASRKILPKELQVAALSGGKLVETSVCSDLMVVVTHPDNPLEALTLEDFGLILRGTYTRWNHVGGRDDPITLHVTQQTSGTAMFLRTGVMENDSFSSDAKPMDQYEHIISELSREKPPAIAYSPLMDALKAEQDKRVKIVAIKKDEKSPAVRPSIATLKDDSYPLVMPLFFYWDEETVRPIAKKVRQILRRKIRLSAAVKSLMQL